MGRRRQAREYALKIMFQIDVGNVVPEEALAYFLSSANASGEVLEYAERLTRGVVRERNNIDGLIVQQAHNWELSRIAPVDRNVLRLAIFELLQCPETPVNVVINEAIEIAKKYSTEESGSFVNAILDKLKRVRDPSG